MKIRYKCPCCGEIVEPNKRRDYITEELVRNCPLCGRELNEDDIIIDDSIED
jgi:endogenous inhibitor of DNA gyrase (YacG/DUF329 family)